VPVAADGSNLPHGGVNDGRYWLEDLPEDEHLREKVRPEGRPCQREGIRAGEADAPPCMWFFCPFNGPTRARIIPFFEEHPLWPDRRARRLLGAPHAAGKQLHQGAPPDAQRRRLVDTSQLEYLDGRGRWRVRILPQGKAGAAGGPDFGVWDTERLRHGEQVRHRLLRSVRGGVSGNTSAPAWFEFKRQWGPRVVYNTRRALNKVARWWLFAWWAREPLVKNLFVGEGATGPKKHGNWATLMGAQIRMMLCVGTGRMPATRVVHTKVIQGMQGMQKIFRICRVCNS
jgi:hypothetical protein